MDLWQQIEKKRHDLDYCIRQLRANGIALAEAERNYKARMRAECLALRNEGMPVTLIQLTVYGVPEVADLRFERDKAEVIYSANKDAINAIKVDIRVLENQLQREYGAPNLGHGSM